MHHVVPKCITRFFPQDRHTVDFLQFNTVPLCDECHHRYELQVSWMKNRLFWDANGVEAEDIRRSERLKATALALTKHHHDIPENRLAEIRAEFDSLASGQTPEEVMSSRSWVRMTSEGWKQVIDHLGGLEATIQFWADHYNSTMNQSFDYVKFSGHS